jgi:beta-xylosidase
MGPLPFTLHLSPSISKLAGNSSNLLPISFVARRQTASLFAFTVDIEFKPALPGEEAGVTAFLTQLQHIDLSIILLSNNTKALRLTTIAHRSEGSLSTDPIVREIPRSWYNQSISLEIKSTEGSAYTFTAAGSTHLEDVRDLGNITATYVSGGSGSYTGMYVF